MRKAKIMAAAAAAAMTMAPIAVQAGTRAESAPVSADMRVASSDGDAEASGLFAGGVKLAWLLLFLAALAAFIAALQGKSRG